MISRATLFRKLQTVKDLVRPISKKHRLRTPFDSQHVEGSQTLVKSVWEHFHQIFSSLWEKLIWKISPLVIREILVAFSKALTANDKYPVRDFENLSSRIQMQLYLKAKPFSESFVPFLESISNFKHFEKKMIVIATLFRKLQTVKFLVRPLSKKHRFRTPLDSHHVKGSQTLVKSAWEQFHHIFSSLWENLILKISPLVIC